MAPDPVTLSGLDGSNPLAFLAALGVLRVLDDLWRREAQVGERPRLRWTEHGGRWRPALTGSSAGTLSAIAQAILNDGEQMRAGDVLGFRYPKVEKAGPKEFRGLAAPLAVARAWLAAAADSRDVTVQSYAGALFSETATRDLAAPPSPVQCEDLGVAFDPGARLDQACMPCFFDFTSRNAQFLDQARIVGTQFDAEGLLQELTRWESTITAGRAMGLDPLSEAPGAIFPSSRTVRLHSAAEWLAFRALPFFRVVGTGDRLHTTACSGRRKEGAFRWPIWTDPTSARAVQSLLDEGLMGRESAAERSARGIVAVFEVDLMKTSDGYNGAFSPTRLA